MKVIIFILNTNILNRKFSYKLSTCLIYSFLLFVSLSISSKETDDVYGLFIKPKSCVIEEKNEHCETIVEVQWRLKSNRNVCLYIDSQNRALACWNDRLFIKEHFSIDISSHVNFQLREKTTNQVIYLAPFSLYLKLAKYRKKRRNPWSFY